MPRLALIKTTVAFWRRRSRREKGVAIAIAAATFLVFAGLVPFVRLPLPPWPAFIPSYETALFFIDLITAALLFDQFRRVRSLSILVLGCAYLFDAFMIVPHALSFPGAFTVTGLLGAKEQTTAWLYVFWHGGFPLFVVGYAVLGRVEEREPRRNLPAGGLLIATAAIGVALLVVGLTLLTTWGHARSRSSCRRAIIRCWSAKASVWLVTLVAMLALWRDKQRVVDLWLMVVMWVWLFDIALSAIIGSKRFDLGFYALCRTGVRADRGNLPVGDTAGGNGAAASAEARLAELSRRCERPQPRPVGGGERTETFIHRQNVAHYRSLLESGALDEAQRRSIERLLDEEKAKDAADLKDS